MKLLIGLLTFFLVTTPLLAEEMISVGCEYIHPNRLEAEIEAVKIANYIAKNAEQVALFSRQVTSPDGQSLWIAQLRIKVPASEVSKIESKLQELAKEEKRKNLY